MEHFGVQKFMEDLKGVRRSKNSIMTVARQVFEDSGKIHAYVQAISSVLSQCNATRRTHILWVVDCIAKRAKDESKSGVLQALESELISICVRVVGSGHKQECMVQLRKAFQVWRDKNRFDSLTISNAERAVTKIHDKVLANTIAKQQFDQKKQKNEDTLRPAGETPEQEFIDAWKASTPEPKLMNLLSSDRDTSVNQMRLATPPERNPSPYDPMDIPSPVSTNAAESINTVSEVLQALDSAYHRSDAGSPSVHSPARSTQPKAHYVTPQSSHRQNMESQDRDCEQQWGRQQDRRNHRRFISSTDQRDNGDQEERGHLSSFRRRDWQERGGSHGFRVDRKPPGQGTEETVNRGSNDRSDRYGSARSNRKDSGSVRDDRPLQRSRGREHRAQPYQYSLDRFNEERNGRARGGERWKHERGAPLHGDHATRSHHYWDNNTAYVEQESSNRNYSANEHADRSPSYGAWESRNPRLPHRWDGDGHDGGEWRDASNSNNMDHRRVWDERSKYSYEQHNQVTTNRNARQKSGGSLEGPSYRGFPDRRTSSNQDTPRAGFREIPPRHDASRQLRRRRSPSSERVSKSGEDSTAREDAHTSSHYAVNEDNVQRSMGLSRVPDVAPERFGQNDSKSRAPSTEDGRRGSGETKADNSEPNPRRSSRDHRDGSTASKPEDRSIMSPDSSHSNHKRQRRRAQACGEPRQDNLKRDSPSPRSTSDEKDDNSYDPTSSPPVKHRPTEDAWVGWCRTKEPSWSEANSMWDTPRQSGGEGVEARQLVKDDRQGAVQDKIAIHQTESPPVSEERGSSSSTLCDGERHRLDSVNQVKVPSKSNSWSLCEDESLEVNRKDSKKSPENGSDDPATTESRTEGTFPHATQPPQTDQAEVNRHCPQRPKQDLLSSLREGMTSERTSPILSHSSSARTPPRNHVIKSKDSHVRDYGTGFSRMASSQRSRNESNTGVTSSAPKEQRQHQGLSPERQEVRQDQRPTSERGALQARRDADDQSYNGFAGTAQSFGWPSGPGRNGGGSTNLDNTSRWRNPVNDVSVGGWGMTDRARHVASADRQSHGKRREVHGLNDSQEKQRVSHRTITQAPRFAPSNSVSESSAYASEEPSQDDRSPRRRFQESRSPSSKQGTTASYEQHGEPYGRSRSRGRHRSPSRDGSPSQGRNRSYSRDRLAQGRLRVYTGDGSPSEDHLRSHFRDKSPSRRDEGVARGRQRSKSPFNKMDSSCSRQRHKASGERIPQSREQHRRSGERSPPRGTISSRSKSSKDKRSTPDQDDRHSTSDTNDWAVKSPIDDSFGESSPSPSHPKRQLEDPSCDKRKAKRARTDRELVFPDDGSIAPDLSNVKIRVNAEALSSDDVAVQAGIRVVVNPSEDISYDSSDESDIDSSETALDKGLAHSGVLDNGDQTNTQNEKERTESAGFNGGQHHSPSRYGNTKTDAFLDTLLRRPQTKVIIWDLDETLIIFNSLITGTYATKHKGSRSIESSVSQRLSKRIEEFLFNILDTHMWFQDLEDADQMNICDILKHVGPHESIDPSQFHRYPVQCNADDEEMDAECSYNAYNVALRFNQIKNLYNEGILEEKLTHSERKEMDKLYVDVDEFTNHWLKIARSAVSSIGTRHNVVNVIVSSGQLIPTIAKLIIFKLNTLFNIENLYSSAFDSRGKRQCFERVQRKFPNCQLLSVGDGSEEEAVSKQMNIPFARVDNVDDLKRLRLA